MLWLKKYHILQSLNQLVRPVHGIRTPYLLIGLALGTSMSKY